MTDGTSTLAGPRLAAAFESRVPAGLRAWYGRHPLVSLCARTALLLGTYVLLDDAARGAGFMSAAQYGEPVLVVAVAERAGIWLVLAGAILAAVLALRGALLDGWQGLDSGPRLRVFLVLLCAVVAWPLASAGYNHFVDQGHGLDRALLVLLVPLIWLRPVFVVPFVLLAMCLLGQIVAAGLPFAPASLPHKLQVLNVVTLFAAAWLLHAASGSRRTDTFVLLACCITAAGYWEPARAKLELGWLSYGHIYRMPLAAWSHGWLSFLAPETIVAFAQRVAVLDWPMRLYVLALEIGALLFLARRWLSPLLLLAAIAFHLAVFAFYGFLFWTWIALDLALLVFLLADWRERRLAIYGWRYFALSVPLIGFAWAWCSPPVLAWFDTPLSYTFRFDAVTPDGTRRALSTRFFAPYDDVFTMSGFGYLVAAHPRLTGPYAVAGSRQVAEALNGPLDAERVFQLEAELGRTAYDAAGSARFRSFIARYAANWNRRREAGDWLAAVRPPPQFWSFPHGPAFAGDAPIREVVVREVTTLYDGESLRPIRDLEVARIAVPGQPAAGAARR